LTRALLREHDACYTDAQLDALGLPDGVDLLTVLRRDDIPAVDRIWVSTLPGACVPTALWRWQAKLVARALARVENTDPRSLAVVALLDRLDSGEDVPQAERDAAMGAAWDATWDAREAAMGAAWDAREAAMGAAWDAARAAAMGAARAAAWDAARDAAWDASRAAAWDAAMGASRAAAWDAVWAAARAAEEKQQIEDLIAVLTEQPR